MNIIRDNLKKIFKVDNSNNIIKKNIILTVDIYTFSVCGVKLGESAEKISFLNIAKFDQSKQGIIFLNDNGIISSFFIAIQKDTHLNSYRGEWTCNGKKIDISVKSKPKHIESFLGKPTNSWKDSIELSYIYEKNGSEIEFLWSKYEKLKYVDISLIKQPAR